MLWRSVGRRDTARNRRVDIEVVATEIRIDFEEQALTLRFYATAGRVILAKLFGVRLEAIRASGMREK